MKQLLAIFTSLLFSLVINAQSVGIGTTTPNASAILDLNSTNKGLLLPRVADTSSIASPVKGLVVFSNNSNKTWIHDGSRWQQNSGIDNIWYQKNDSLAYSNKSYIGINTDPTLLKPQAHLQVEGKLLVQGHLDYTNSNPTAAQVYIMPNTAANTQIAQDDSVFRIYDPGGTSNYPGNSQGNVRVSPESSQTAYKVSSVAADWSWGVGDTLWISEFPYPTCKTSYIRRYLAGSVDPGDFTLPCQSSIYFIFRANNDASFGKGFHFRITRLFHRSPSPFNPPAISGDALYYDNEYGGFTVGLNCKTTTGVAMGEDAQSGNVGFAFGSNVYATHQGFAFGNGVEARGVQSVAIGNGAQATGQYTTAIGTQVEASYDYAIAIGHDAHATTTDAMAFGRFAYATGESALAINGTASGSYSSSFGGDATGLASLSFRGDAAADYSISMCRYGLANSYSGMVIGQFNYPSHLFPQTALSASTALFAVGNGTGLNLSERSNAFVVTNGGNVAIGTTNTSPDDRLVINGPSGTTINLQANGVETGYLQLSSNDIRMGTYASNPTGNIILRSNGSNQFTIFPSGNATLAGSLSQNSDARYKENIKPIDNALDKLMQLNGYEYNWKPELKKDTAVQIGLIAQNVEKVFPQLVTTNQEGMKSVAYQNLVAVLIESVKEQQQQISKQQEEINELKKVILLKDNR
jgi:hypothetical protein